MATARRNIVSAGPVNKWLSIIAIILMCFIATALQYHHHVGDRVCFLWSDNHTQLHCCHDKAEATLPHPINHQDDDCGLHTTQIYIESQNDQNDSNSSLSWISVHLDMYGCYVHPKLFSFADIEVQKSEISDDISINDINSGKSIVWRGPPDAV